MILCYGHEAMMMDMIDEYDEQTMTMQDKHAKLIHKNNKKSSLYTSPKKALYYIQSVQIYLHW